MFTDTNVDCNNSSNFLSFNEDFSLHSPKNSKVTSTEIFETAITSTPLNLKHLNYYHQYNKTQRHQRKIIFKKQ